MARRILLLVLSLQLALPTHLLAQSHQSGSSMNDKSNTTESSVKENPLIKRAASNIDEHDKELQKELLTFADLVENKTVQAKDLPDAFAIRNQKISYFKKGNFDFALNLNNYAAKRPLVSFTTARIHWDPGTQELWIDAISGEDSHGRNGNIQARWHITDLGGDPIVQIIEDREMFILVSSYGRIHAMDKFTTFKNMANSEVIPLFKKIWEPSYNLKLTQDSAKVSFLTRGSRPYKDYEVNADSIIPHGVNGEEAFEAGDVYLRTVGAPIAKYGVNSQGEETYIRGLGQVIGVFSRRQIYKRMALGFGILYKKSISAAMDALDLGKHLSPEEYEALGLDPIKEKEMNRIEKIIELARSSDQSLQEMYAQHMPIQEQQALLAMSSQGKERFFQRMLTMTKTSGRDLDTFNLKNWKADFDQMWENARSQKLKQDELEVKLERQWAQTLSPASAKAASEREEFLEQRERSYETNFRLAVFGTVGALFAFPHVYEAMPATLQFAPIEWLYDSLNPVLKAEHYRWPLFFAVMSNLFIIPMQDWASSFAGWSIDKYADSMKGRMDEKAQKARELANIWGKKAMGQGVRVITAGWRLFAALIYPVWKLAIVDILGQKTFFSALESNLNPFQVIQAKSELGKRLGLTKNQMVGLNGYSLSEFQPLKGKFFPSPDKETVRRKLQIQSDMGQQKLQAESMAVTLAFVAVAERYGLDPAILMDMAERGVSDRAVDHVLVNKEATQELMLTTISLNKDLSKLAILDFDESLAQVDPHVLAQSEELARKTAEEISKDSKMLRRLKMISAGIKNGGAWLREKLVNFAKEDVKFLKTELATKDLASLVLSQFKVDFGLFGGLYSVYGDRADMRHPENLLARPYMFGHDSFLYNNTAHLVDVVDQYYVYNVSFAANQGILTHKASPSLDSTYLPKAVKVYQDAYREKSLYGSLKDWAYGNLPTVGDPGGYVNRKFFKRFPNFQTYIYFELPVRYALTSLTLGDSFLGLSLSFVAATWWFGWPWIPIVIGNMFLYKRIKESKAVSDLAKASLGRALEASTLDETQSFLEKGMKQIVQLFEVQNTQLFNESHLLLMQTLGDKAPESIHKRPWGLAVSYLKAVEQGQKEKAMEIREQILSFVSEETGAKKEELLKMDAESMLQFIAEKGIIFTNSNTYLDRFTNGAGAIITTILSISLAVTTTNPQWLHQDGLIQFVFLGSMALYAGSYLLFGKKPWIFYLKKIDVLKTKFAEYKEMSADRKLTLAQKKELLKELRESLSVKNQIRCDQIFVR